MVDNQEEGAGQVQTLADLYKYKLLTKCSFEQMADDPAGLFVWFDKEFSVMIECILQIMELYRPELYVMGRKIEEINLSVEAKEIFDRFARQVRDKIKQPQPTIH